MFNYLKESFEHADYNQYEISNFSLKGYESKHNMIYWSDLPYWGIGLSAHSYFPNHNLRFWNPKSMQAYHKLIDKNLDNFSLVQAQNYFKTDQFEYLQINEQMTDFCHTHLRKNNGIPKAALRKKFESNIVEIIVNKLETLSLDCYIDESVSHWSLSAKGHSLSNLVFQELCFAKDELICRN